MTASPSPTWRPVKPEDHGPLTDCLGRTINYLRLSVTDRCNLRCLYCSPDGHTACAPRADLLTIDELLRVGAIFAGMGVDKIRLTGGEPLVRRGVCELAAGLRRLPGVREVGLTTNGTLLERFLPALAEAGVSSLNVSLDSLDPDTARRVGGKVSPARVLASVDEALRLGLRVKLNVVVLRGINDGELSDFVALTRDRALEVRFIEVMPFDGAGGRHKPLVATEILARVGEDYTLVPAMAPRASVARVYSVAGHRGRVGVISGHTRSFCDACNRVRVSAKGELRTCLYGRPALDLGARLRAGAPDDELAHAVRLAVHGRHANGRDSERAGGLAGRPTMSNIGG